MEIADLAKVELLDVGGASVRLGSLWDKAPVALLWIRHYG